jgi:hypothetical protein
LFFEETRGLGTDSREHHQALLPLYSLLRSPNRDSTSYLWPLGVTITDDRTRRYREVGAPWPLIVFARGEGKTISRVWPFFSQAHNATQEINWYCWPAYRVNRLHSPPLDRERIRLFFFLYSHTKEANLEGGAVRKRSDFWPLFTASQDWSGHRRFQALALLEPLLPNSRSVVRDYSQVWSLWRWEKNAATGASSQSFLWNLWRREATPETKKCSLLFGLFQYQSSPPETRWRLFYIPIRVKKPPAAERAAGR